jgi:hypothetical protein
LFEKNEEIKETDRERDRKAERGKEILTFSFSPF